MFDVNDVTVRNNRIFDASLRGVLIEGSDTVAAASNTLNGGVDGMGKPTALWGMQIRAEGCRIERNLIRHTATGILLPALAGPVVRGCLVADNVVTTADIGIHSQTTGTYLCGNVLTGTSSAALLFGGTASTGNSYDRNQFLNAATCVVDGGVPPNHDGGGNYCLPQSRSNSRYARTVGRREH